MNQTAEPPGGASSCLCGSCRPRTLQPAASVWTQREAEGTRDGCGRQGRTGRSRRFHSQAETSTQIVWNKTFSTLRSSDTNLTGFPTCRVLQVKSDCSSPQTLSAATTSTMTRKMKSTESQIFPKLVEWRFAPTNCVYRAGQDILQKEPEMDDFTLFRSYIPCLIVLFELHIWQRHRWTFRLWEGRQWQRMKAESGEETKGKSDRRRGWKGMKLRGGGRWKDECQNSCELMNLCAHCGLYWTKPTQLKSHWAHCTHPRYYRPHLALSFILSDTQMHRLAGIDSPVWPITWSVTYMRCSVDKCFLKK